MAERYAEDFFEINRWILRLAGLWRPDGENKIVKILYTVYAVGIFLFVNLYFTTTEFLSLMYTLGNEYDLIKNVSFALTHLMGAVKVIFFYYRGDRMKKIMATLESSSLHYEPSLKMDFSPAITSKKYKEIGMRYTMLFFLLAHATLSSSYIPPMLAAILYENNDPEKALPEKLPYYSWMPFKYQTRRSYLLALGYQAVPMFSYAYSIVGMDTLFMNIMNCIALNLDIIQGAFFTVTERALTKVSLNGIYNSGDLNNALHDEIKKIYKHLQTVYNVCEDLESVHNYLTLAQTTATLFILCSCLYLVSTTPVNSKQFYAEIVYMTAMGFQLILYCWFGNEVTLKADKMSFYIWQSDWLTADIDFKKSIIFTMMRTRRKLCLTAGKFAPLTLPTFLAIIKASYSFYAVIKNTSDI